MPNPYFSFKQFTVFQDKCAMKVGVDGVLLGAWTEINEAKNILDIGTGTGLIALMLAQRCQAQIEAIDIDPNAISQAYENAMNSPWHNRITLKQIDVQQFSNTSLLKYDLIVSNPPYFINSTKTPEANRTVARHTDTLSHNDLLVCARKLISPNGRLCLILPVNEGTECVKLAENIGFHCSKMIRVFPKPDSIAKRLLLEFCLEKTETCESELTIESNIRHQYSSEFTEIAKDYYLKL